MVAHDVRRARRRSRASIRGAAKRSDASSSTLARKWSSRPPCATDDDHRASRRAPRAASSASSRSVASLSVGWRSTAAPAATAPSSAAGSTESRSPTTTSTRATERLRVLEARVGGDHEGVGGESCVATVAGARRIAAGEHERVATCTSQSAPIFPPPALPGSGSRGRRRCVTVALSARLSRAPRRCDHARTRAGGTRWRQQSEPVTHEVVLVRHGATEWSRERAAHRFDRPACSSPRARRRRQRCAIGSVRGPSPSCS